MASIHAGDNTSNNNTKSSTSKKNKRKHKAKSLIVSTTSKNDSNNATTNAQSGTSLSAECDSIKFGLRPRFSFRKFGRRRNSAKPNSTDSNQNASTSSETNLKCPAITCNDTDGEPSVSPPIPQAPLATSSIQSKL